MSAEEIAEMRHMNIDDADRLARKLNLQVLYDRDHQCADLEDRYIYNSPFRRTLTGEQKVRDEDGNLRCTHQGENDLEYTPPCCNGSDCDCRGLWSIFCNGCDNEDLSDHEAETLLNDHLEDVAEAKAGYYD